jgi:hypothetical protein
VNYFDSDNYFKGYLGKDIVRSLLETSGYTVCHYGYEDMFLDFKSKSNLLNSTSNTGRRIRKSPDLLVYDDENIILAEVKLRLELPPRIAFKEIALLKEYWNDAVLVLVVPDDNMFYAQTIEKLENKEEFNRPISDFGKLQEVFKKVTDDHLAHYREMTLPILVSLMGKYQKMRYGVPSDSP